MRQILIGPRRSLIATIKVSAQTSFCTKLNTHFFFFFSIEMGVMGIKTGYLLQVSRIFFKIVKFFWSWDCGALNFSTIELLIASDFLFDLGKRLSFIAIFPENWKACYRPFPMISKLFNKLKKFTSFFLKKLQEIFKRPYLKTNVLIFLFFLLRSSISIKLKVNQIADDPLKTCKTLKWVDILKLVRCFVYLLFVYWVQKDD